MNGGCPRTSTSSHGPVHEHRTARVASGKLDFIHVPSLSDDRRRVSPNAGSGSLCRVQRVRVLATVCLPSTSTFEMVKFEGVLFELKGIGQPVLSHAVVTDAI